MAIILQLVIINLLLILSSYSFAQRQEGGVECATTQGDFRVHFTAYQAPQGLQGSTYLERYCEQIPLPGEIFMTLDIYKTHGFEIIRDKPVTVRLLEGAPGAEANRTLLELPAKIYRSGIVELHPKLPAPGDYHLLVAIGENPSEEDTITIPVRVRIKSGFLSMDSATGRMLLLMLVVLGILTAYSFYSGRKGQSKENKS
ncbi:MAG: hypothetical protein ACREX4_04040 [Gammaproteobacteria bacterium]